MANEVSITVVGNATKPELRFTPAGKAVCNFSLASQPRTYDKQTQSWVDGDTMWLNCAAWGPLGEHLIESFGDQKSLRVIVTGRLKSRSYETRDGQRRTVFEVDVEDVGPSLRWATARVARSGGQSQQPQGQQSRQQGDPWASNGPARASDPWAANQAAQGWTANQSGQGDAWAQSNDSEPPF